MGFARRNRRTWCCNSSLLTAAISVRLQLSSELSELAGYIGTRAAMMVLYQSSPCIVYSCARCYTTFEGREKVAAFVSRKLCADASLERNHWLCCQHWELKQRKQRLYCANAAANAFSAHSVCATGLEKKIKARLLGMTGIPPFWLFYAVTRFWRSRFYVLPLLSFIHTSPTNSVIRASLFFFFFIVSHEPWRV